MGLLLVATMAASLVSGNACAAGDMRDHIIHDIVARVPDARYYDIVDPVKVAAALKQYNSAPPETHDQGDEILIFYAPSIPMADEFMILQNKCRVTSTELGLDTIAAILKAAGL